MLLRIPSREIVIGHGNVRAPHTVPRPRNVSSGWTLLSLSPRYTTRGLHETKEAAEPADKWTWLKFQR